MTRTRRAAKAAKAGTAAAIPAAVSPGVPPETTAADKAPVWTAIEVRPHLRQVLHAADGTWPQDTGKPAEDRADTRSCQ